MATTESWLRIVTERDIMILALLLEEGRVVKGLLEKTQGTDNTQQVPLAPLSVLEPCGICSNKQMFHALLKQLTVDFLRCATTFVYYLIVKKHYHTDYLLNISLQSNLLNYNKPQMQRSPLSIVPLSLKYQTCHLRFYIIHFV